MVVVALDHPATLHARPEVLARCLSFRSKGVSGGELANFRLQTFVPSMATNETNVSTVFCGKTGWRGYYCFCRFMMTAPTPTSLLLPVLCHVKILKFAAGRNVCIQLTMTIVKRRQSSNKAIRFLLFLLSFLLAVCFTYIVHQSHNGCVVDPFTAVSSSSVESKSSSEKAKSSPAFFQNERSLDQCRALFKTSGQGGNAESTEAGVQTACAKTPFTFDVCDDLKAFTGLGDQEFMDRLTRKGIFHFEGEHKFWNPKTNTELAWYYSTSVNYLFANALHGVWEGKIKPLTQPQFSPVLDYSGGVGNNVIYLAERGVECQYFGIGMMEYRFAQYRVRKRGLGNLVTFVEPYSERSNWKFDPINAPLPRDGSLGSIIAMDVLEHIPDYHVVVAAMVESLKVGGGIVEVTPFDQNVVENDTRVHLSNGGIDMKTAMGPKMKREGPLWIKIAP